MKPDTFDEYAQDYEAALNKGLRLSGESKEFFARERIARTREMVGSLPAHAAVLDYGCGTGDALGVLVEAFGAESGVGVEVSAESVRVAAQNHKSDKRLSFHTLEGFSSPASFDLAYCNGVFHHIPPVDRPAALAYVLQQLKPGGFFAFWENNPANIGTRLVMKMIPFDRDAVTIRIREAQDLLQAAGFRIITRKTLFLFPRPFNRWKRLEQAMLRWPIGAQYIVLCQRPAN